MLSRGRAPKKLGCTPRCSEVLVGIHFGLRRVDNWVFRGPWGLEGARGWLRGLCALAGCLVEVALVAGEWAWLGFGRAGLVSEI